MRPSQDPSALSWDLGFCHLDSSILYVFIENHINFLAHSLPLEMPSESDRSASPDTRATTPSSTLEKSHFPENYLYLAITALSPSTISTLFDKYASCDRLGLIVDHSPNPVFPTQDGWVKQSLSSQPVHFISSTYLAPVTQSVCQPRIHTFRSDSFSFFIFIYFYKVNFPISTDPLQANQHRIFSLAALRAIFSTFVPLSCTLHILERPPFVYPPLSHTISCSLAPSADGSLGNIPTPAEWNTLWASWDLITLQMIPQEMLHQKPIHLRHKSLFYIGHIPTYYLPM